MTARALLVALALLAAGGCRKRADVRPRPTPDAAAISCPPAESLAALLKEPGRALRTGCVAFADVHYWMAAALGFDEKTRAEPALRLVFGGPTSRGTVFDVVPAPVESIRQLLGEQIEVRVRPAKSNRNLIRIGVVGRRPTGEADEVVTLLQLVAHAPPRLLWSGPGDQVTVADGCVTERSVDFQMLFGRNVETIAFTRGRPREPGSKQECPSGPGMQEPLPTRAVPLPAGRPLFPPDGGA